MIEKLKNIFNQHFNVLILQWNQNISQNSFTLDNQNDKISLIKENERLLKIDLESIKERWNLDRNLLIKAENEIKELKTKLERQEHLKQEETLTVKEDVKEIMSEENFNSEYELIKTHYENEIDDLKYQLFLVDGKAAYYYQEVEYLNENIKLIIVQLNEKEELISQLNQNLNNLNEELEMTRQRYEDQIRTMSEHIALMNDRLTEQAEIIDKLNNISKNNPSGKNKKK